MSPEQVFRTIVSLVPNWYMAEYGPKKVQIQVGDSSFECHALINPPPSLRKFREKSEALAAKLMTCPSAIYPTFGDILREALALAWLQQATDKIDWAKLLDYAGPLADRTYENAPVTVNVIARPSETGLHDLADERFGKITDHLSSGLFTYFIVDGSLRVADYCEVGWDEITTSASYKLYPELPHPFQCVMKKCDYSFHLTRQRDFLVSKKGGLLAARRKRRWKIYDVATLKNHIVSGLGSYKVGANVFEVLFDLSLRRHGALLVYDPQDKAILNVANPECRIDTGIPSAGRELIVSVASKINLAGSVGKVVPNKRLLLEMAGIDGAVIFNDSQITAVGAIINTHEEASGKAGARSTASLSAYHWGGRPAKVSADGEINIIFKSDRGDQECRAELEWL